MRHILALVLTLTIVNTGVGISMFLASRGLEWGDHIQHTHVAVNGFCSGTVIDASEQLILTNSHCLFKETVKVKQMRYDRYKVEAAHMRKADIVFKEPNADIAVIRPKKPLPDLQAAKISAEVPALGQTVYFVGNPIRKYGSLNRGIVSSINRSTSYGGKPLWLYQVSGGFWGGNSGGSLYDTEQNLIGIPSYVEGTGSSADSVAGGTLIPHIGYAISGVEIATVLRNNGYGYIVDKMPVAPSA